MKTAGITILIICLIASIWNQKKGNTKLALACMFMAGLIFGELTRMI